MLLPALAWLQYSWLDQIADADRERRARTLQTAVWQLTQDFDNELGKAVLGLQLDPAMVEQQAWSAFAERYQMWAASALSPDIVKSIYFVERVRPNDTPGRDPLLRAWNPEGQTFSETAWPEELATLRARFVHDAAAPVIDLQLPPRRGERGPQRLMFPHTPAGDEESIVVPVMRIADGGPRGPAATGPPDMRLLGFTIIRLDTAALGEDVLPVLVRRHMFGDRAESDFVVAVVARDDPARVIYESEPGTAAIAAASPDETISLLSPRMGPLLFMARGDMRRGGGRFDTTRDRLADSHGPPPPAPGAGSNDNFVVNVIETRRDERGMSVQTRTIAGGEGHWRLVAKHRAGSLEAAVAAARTRNFVLSSGILALLATAIGLIVVSARRADALARQQLEFVAAVSHELRTPVSVIGAAAGNLADGVVDEPGRVKKYGATIQTEARRLAETVERVLQLAGIAAGRAAASPSVIDGHRLISDAIGAVRHDIDSAGITVEHDVPDVLPPVRGDALALRSALQNLIGNAVKYAGDGRWVRIAARASGRTLSISVSDRGLGITAEDRKHIFQPFYRGREAVSRQIQGSGLGLHLVRRIVEAHGGSVAVRSEPGQGSTFTIELPIAHESGAAAGSGASTSPAAAGV
jgi:signal transduction histidine kinase